MWRTLGNRPETLRDRFRIRSIATPLEYGPLVAALQFTSLAFLHGVDAAAAISSSASALRSNVNPCVVGSDKKPKEHP